MIDIKLATIKDVALILLDEEIHDRSNPDGALPADKCSVEKANTKGWLFIGGYLKGQVVSLFAVKGGLLHFFVLKPFRKHAREALNKSINYYGANLFVKIPKLYQASINLALNHGFRSYGLSKDKFIKNGKSYDIEIMRFKWVV